MPLPPHAIAGIDQELADLDAHLDHMIGAFRAKTIERGELRTLADLAVTVTASYDPETCGELVAAAVRRLALDGGR